MLICPMIMYFSFLNQNVCTAYVVCFIRQSTFLLKAGTFINTFRSYMQSTIIHRAFLSSLLAFCWTYCLCFGGRRGRGEAAAEPEEEEPNPEGKKGQPHSELHWDRAGFIVRKTEREEDALLGSCGSVRALSPSAPHRGSDFTHGSVETWRALKGLIKFSRHGDALHVSLHRLRLDRSGDATRAGRHYEVILVQLDWL